MSQRGTGGRARSVRGSLWMGLQYEICGDVTRERSHTQPERTQRGVESSVERASAVSKAPGVLRRRTQVHTCSTGGDGEWGIPNLRTKLQ